MYLFKLVKLFSYEYNNQRLQQQQLCHQAVLKKTFKMEYYGMSLTKLK